MEQTTPVGDEVATTQKAARAFSGAAMRARREKEGLSRPDLLIKLFEAGVRVSEVTLLRYESGESVPDVNTAERIARALGVRLDNLLA